MSKINILFAVLTLVAAVISYRFYRRDDSADFFTGKTQAIRGVYGARTLIIGCQFIVPLIALLSLFSTNPWLAQLSVPYKLAVQGLGIVVGAVGTFLFVAAKMRLGSNYSPCYRSYVPQGLTVGGVYGFIRHPIYAANLYLIMAGFLVSQSLWVLLAFAAMLQLYYRTAKIEEAVLSERFPQDYRAYMEHTGRFIPRFWRRS